MATNESGLAGSCHCGAVSWRMDVMPQTVTTCSCTICRRYGVMWSYGHIGHTVHTSGETSSYRRGDSGDIDFHFCATCGCATHYIAVPVDAEGRQRAAVNMRLAEPDLIEHLPVRHFDGLATFETLPADNRCIADMWF